MGFRDPGRWLGGRSGGSRGTEGRRTSRIDSGPGRPGGALQPSGSAPGRSRHRSRRDPREAGALQPPASNRRGRVGQGRPGGLGQPPRTARFGLLARTRGHGRFRERPAGPAGLWAERDRKPGAQGGGRVFPSDAAGRGAEHRARGQEGVLRGPESCGPDSTGPGEGSGTRAGRAAGGGASPRAVGAETGRRLGRRSARPRPARRDGGGGFVAAGVRRAQCGDGRRADASVRTAGTRNHGRRSRASGRPVV